LLSCSASTFFQRSQSITNGLFAAGIMERTAWGRTERVYLTLASGGLLKESSEIVYQHNTEKTHSFQ